MLLSKNLPDYNRTLHSRNIIAMAQRAAVYYSYMRCEAQPWASMGSLFTEVRPSGYGDRHQVRQEVVQLTPANTMETLRALFSNGAGLTNMTGATSIGKTTKLPMQMASMNRRVMVIEPNDVLACQGKHGADHFGNGKTAAVVSQLNVTGGNTEVVYISASSFCASIATGFFVSSAVDTIIVDESHVTDSEHSVVRLYASKYASSKVVIYMTATPNAVEVLDAYGHVRVKKKADLREDDLVNKSVLRFVSKYDEIQGWEAKGYLPLTCMMSWNGWLSFMDRVKSMSMPKIVTMNEMSAGVNLPVEVVVDCDKCFVLSEVEEQLKMAETSVTVSERKQRKGRAGRFSNRGEFFTNFPEALQEVGHQFPMNGLQKKFFDFLIASIEKEDADIGFLTGLLSPDRYRESVERGVPWQEYVFREWRASMSDESGSVDSDYSNDGKSVVSLDPGGKLVAVPGGIADNNLFALVSQIMNEITNRERPPDWPGNYSVCRKGNAIQSGYDQEVYRWFTKETYMAEHSRVRFRERLDSGLTVRNYLFDSLHYVFAKLKRKGIKPDTLVAAKESAQKMDIAIGNFVAYMKRDVWFVYVHRDGTKRYEHDDYIVSEESGQIT